MFICTNCDSQFNKWAGKCENCQSWSTLKQQEFSTKNRPSKNIKVQNLSDINDKELPLTSTGFSELDNIFNGGFIKGSLILLGGEPGIGKSTFGLQLADKIIENTTGKILYISGEESALQIKNRAKRLSINEDNFSIYTNSIVEDIINTSILLKPTLVIIDSIQTVYSEDIPSETGSIAQIRGTVHKILESHKQHNITTLIISQITKDGSIAGPKMLEHLVDSVLYIEGDKETELRILRVHKNRFGPTNEICLFKMEKEGLKSVKNINQDFIDNSSEDFAYGAGYTAVSEANKIFIMEIQALVTKTVFGYPQRKTSGISTNKLQILSAVISKFTKTNLTNSDIHLTISAGQKSNDPGSDLAICAAIISSEKNIPICRNAIFIGEVGLGGEIKPVKNISSKIKEASKLGFKSIVIPAKQSKNTEDIKIPTESSTIITKIKNIRELEIWMHNKQSKNT